MQTILSKIAVIFLLLVLLNGISNITTGEARTQNPKSDVQKQKKVDCTSAKYCDPFSPKIDIACKDSGDCQTLCNNFDGIFVCYDAEAYCKCQLDS
ncbi:hypothetical protein vseg_001717 [Gypsophila vaccaria]